MRLLVLGLVACSASKTTVTPSQGSLVATETTAIEGNADFPPQHVDDPDLKGKVANLTAESNRWTLAVEDNANLRHTYSIVLPANVTFAIATGTSVVVESRFTGGGPNARGQISITDDKGALYLAISHVPAGWKADAGALVAEGSVRRGPVRITEPGGTAVELASSPWRKFSLAGATFVGNGEAAAQDAPDPLPPDFVSAWMDFTVVRAE